MLRKSFPECSLLYHGVAILFGVSRASCASLSFVSPHRIDFIFVFFARTEWINWSWTLREWKSSVVFWIFSGWQRLQLYRSSLCHIYLTARNKTVMICHASHHQSRLIFLSTVAVVANHLYPLTPPIQYIPLLWAWSSTVRDNGGVDHRDKHEPIASKRHAIESTWAWRGCHSMKRNWNDELGRHTYLWTSGGRTSGESLISQHNLR